MLARNSNKIGGVLAANDGLAGAVIASLKAHGLKPIPLTGQDATPTGIAVHPRRLAERNGLQVGPQGGERRGHAAIALIKGKKVPGVTARSAGRPRSC